MKRNKKYVVITEECATVVGMTPELARKLQEHARNPVLVVAKR
jgi:hypothetical protein